MQPVRSLFCKDEMGICSPSSDKIPGWREVSVCGELYVPRETRSKSQRGVLYIGNESNCLIDGTLIDLCGVTMLWRSAEGCSQFQMNFSPYFCQWSLYRGDNNILI